MKLTLIRNQLSSKPIIPIAFFSLLTLAQPVAAHHPFGGTTPSNFWEGFSSGLGHPIVGLDHFAFIVASGLLGTKFKQGFLIPVAFIIATMAGTVIHLQEINLPQPELIIAGSVVLFGGLLIIKNYQFFASYFSTIIVATLAMIGGIFHGYAYGEAIVGAEMTPLFAYLVGFGVIQLLISFAAFLLGNMILQRFKNRADFILQIVGAGISTLGFFFLGGA
ncbi:MAG: HupE/UreJ family protein [Cyanobacteria bacterium P01_G01_bin.49]